MSMELYRKEASASQSEPAEFYHFTVADQEYLYTSAEYDISYQGRTYLKAAIQRGAIDGTTDPDKGTMKITAPYLLPIVQQMLVISPSFPIALTIYRAQKARESYFDASDESPDNLLTVLDAYRAWTGRIHSCEITGDEVAINAISILNQQFRMGNTLRYQKSCPYALYEQYNCRVPFNALMTEVTILPGNVLTASKVQSDGLVWGNIPQAFGKPERLAKHWFVGGYVTYFDTFANVEGRRAVVEYDPAQGIIAVFPPLRGFVEGSYMKVRAGCSHNSTDCKEKFDNILNYGGDPMIPTQDPYDPFTQVF